MAETRTKITKKDVIRALSSKGFARFYPTMPTVDRQKALATNKAYQSYQTSFFLGESRVAIIPISVKGRARDGQLCEIEGILIDAFGADRVEYGTNSIRVKGVSR